MNHPRFLRKRLLAAGLALVIVSASGAVVSATTMRALSIDDLATESSAIVVGTVRSVGEIVTVADGRLVPRTVATIDVAERVAGADTGPTVRIVEAQGRLGALRFVRDGVTEMRRGQRVLLFLARHESGYRTLGMAQGAFVIGTDRLTGTETIARAGEPGLLVGSTKARDIDLEARPSLRAIRSAVRDARAAR